MNFRALPDVMITNTATFLVSATVQFVALCLCCRSPSRDNNAGPKSLQQVAHVTLAGNFPVSEEHLLSL
jgi:hypothetical protein